MRARADRRPLCSDRLPAGPSSASCCDPARRVPGWTGPPASPTCGRWPGGAHRGRSSTTPTAARARRSACAGPGRPSTGWSSARACCGTSRTVDTVVEVLGPAGRAAVRLRADRLHPADARRGRAGGRPGRRAGRRPVRAVDDGHDLAGGAGGGGARRPAGGSSSTCGATARRAGTSSGGRAAAGLRGAGADRGHPGRRVAAARRAQRPDASRRRSPCGPSPTRPCTRPGGSTC